MIFLNESGIKEAISMKEMIDAIDLSYEMYHANDFLMPTRMQITNNENTLLIMPTVMEEVIGTKLVTVFPNNVNIPRLHGVVVLTSNATGEIKAILDGTCLTSFRTGAVGGSAVRHFANDTSETLTIIGTGVQGFYQAIAACTERPIKKIKLYNRTTAKMPAFISRLKQEINSTIEITAHSSAADAIKGSDIIMTATNSNEPVLPNDPHLLKNKLIIGIGSFQPKMREFPEALYDITDLIFIDTKDAIEESGDIHTPLKNNWIKEQSVQTMASFLASNEKIKKENGKSIVFKSTGMGLFDAVTANIIYKKAKELAIGQQLHS
ncbi:ornithine cyclodeaminase family protein [Pseudogracilibacillus auburnensis]|uniref:ornithine cyclodeaminase family protein n=1 Tax=Pseudogracilibacillus auburnensis TaxID=1494959 RepID=UPI001A977009|nr:ornithine cyclodeaminase family protein [Pseudogracilibacillus auburnensis]MBO1001785.1 ornithine cyclodeaminase family protein [Pseudogracilibacillus auburnensis]